MSFQDSSSTPYLMEYYLGDDEKIGGPDEVIGGIEIGELLDINNFDNSVPTETQVETQTGGQSTVPDQTTGAEDDSQPNPGAYGKGGRTFKSIVHKEMKLITLPDGTKKWQCNWCGKQYSYQMDKSTSNAKKTFGGLFTKKTELRSW